MSDETAAIRATLAGDVGAFTVLVEQYQHPVHNLCYRMLGNAEEAADGAQEAFLRAYAQLATYDLGRSFASWLLSIAAHYCLDVIRKRRHIRVSLEAAEQQVDCTPGPDETALSRERKEAVRELLDRLPAAYRLAIVLRYWYDLPCEEIAQISGASLGAVKTRLHRARALLVDSIEQGSADGHPSDLQPRWKQQGGHVREQQADTVRPGSRASLHAERRDARGGVTWGAQLASLRLRGMPALR